MNIKKVFDKHNNEEFLMFERITHKRSTRRDIHAFLLLGDLEMNDLPIVGHAEHDQIGLDIDVEKLAAVITEEQVIELLRCGVMFDGDTESLSMFV